MTPFVDLTEREREIAHANFNAFKRRLERERKNECPNCNPTAQAYALVEAQWVVAGIDKGD